MMPTNRKEFERNLNILVENSRNGKVRLPPDRKLMHSLLNARHSPNRRTNFLTVNESARLLANTLANFDRPEFKNKEDAEQ